MYDLGIFDSGKGGEHIKELLLNKGIHNDITILLDKEYLPYGDKSIDLVRKRTIYFIHLLNSLSIDVIIIACNSAAATIINDKITYTDLILYEPITPVCNYILSNKLNKIVVIATKITCSIKPHNYYLQYKCTYIDASYLVNLIELNKTTNIYIRNMCKNIQLEHIDAVVLGCTHFPIIKSIFVKELANLQFSGLILDPNQIMVDTIILLFIIRQSIYYIIINNNIII